MKYTCHCGAEIGGLDHVVVQNNSDARRYFFNFWCFTIKKNCI